MLLPRLADADPIGNLSSAFYDAAIDATLWSSALDRLRGRLGLAASAATLFDAAHPQHMAYFEAGMDPGYLGSYLNHYVRYDPVHPFLARSPVLTVTTAAMAAGSEAALQRSEFYNGWARPQGFRDGLFALAMREGSVNSTVVLMPGPRRNTITEDGQRLFSALLPHLGRALRLSSHLALNTMLPRGAVADALDRVAVPLLMTNASSRVAWANRAAELLLQANGVIGVEARSGGILRAVTAEDTAALRALVAAAAAGRGGEVELGALDEKRRTVVVIAFPSSRSGVTALPNWPGPLVLLGVIDLRSDASRGMGEKAMSHRLRKLFDLTAAEQRVAMCLAEGVGLPTVADRLGVAVSTVRTHAQRIFDKTEVRGHAELVRLVSRLANLDHEEP